jgi:putative tricarboxylic transport membrane protein
MESMRTLAIVAAVAVLPASHLAQAQSAWRPGKNVEIVIPVAKGGGTDVTGRLVQSMFAREKLVATGTRAVNKPGGGGVETWDYLRGRAGDGHFLAISTPPLLTNRITGADTLDYADFTPITTLYSEYVLVAVAADSPIKSGHDLAERFRKDSAGVSMAVAPALGSHNHIAPALIARAAGGDATKPRVEVLATGRAAAAAAIDGRADIVASTIGTLLKDVQAGRLRPLGITAPRRLGGPLANVPTWREQGIDVVVPAWRGIVGPPKMTPAQVAYWEGVFLQLSLNADWLEELRNQWWEGSYMSSAETRKFLEEQYALMKDALTVLKLAK